jgi:hypothetical protein
LEGPSRGFFFVLVVDEHVIAVTATRFAKSQSELEKRKDLVNAPTRQCVPALWL